MMTLLLKLLQHELWALDITVVCFDIHGENEQKIWLFHIKKYFS